jgi:hypothetical protein
MKTIMSVAGYLSSRYNPELRMPKSGEHASNRGDTQKDTLSIRYEGPVLTGEKSVEQRQRDVGIHATSYRPVVDCGPPLRRDPPSIPGRSALPLESKPRTSGPGITWKVKK